MAAGRNSDRWITPGVIIAALLVAGLLLTTVAGGVTYLAARGVDPDPMIRLVAQIATSVGALGTLALQLFGRATAAKTERNTGVLVGAVDELAAATTTPAPTPPAAPPAAYPRRPIDDHLPDVDDGAVDYGRVPVPPIPAMPRHLAAPARRRTDA